MCGGERGAGYRKVLSGLETNSCGGGRRGAGYRKVLSGD